MRLKISGFTAPFFFPVVLIFLKMKCPKLLLHVRKEPADMASVHQRVIHENRDGNRDFLGLRRTFSFFYFLQTKFGIVRFRSGQGMVSPV